MWPYVVSHVGAILGAVIIAAGLIAHKYYQMPAAATTTFMTVGLAIFVFGVSNKVGHMVLNKINNY